jgi:EAL and modified HD-GYP domain-containing signal transduction protein
MFKLPWKRSDTGARAAGIPPEPEAAAAAETPAAPAARTVYAARQPILGRTSDVVGYEILFRGGPENRFDGSNLEIASATSIEQSTAAIGLDALVGDRTAFVNLTRGALLAGFHRMMPPERSVIELLENIEPDAEVLDAVRAIRAEGYQVALDDYTFAAASEPFLDVVDMVKVDFRLAKQACRPDALAGLKRRRLKLLAEKVETHAEHEAATAAGYDLFQGYYFCKPVMIQARDLSPSKLSVLRFLSEVSREDASFEKLEELFKQDVSLTMRLLRYLNSAAFGWRHEIGSLRHALALMGLRPLRKWAMMMGMISLCDDQPNELAVTALARGRFAERIGPPAGLEKQEVELFLTGMLSLADTMVGRPAQEVLKGLALPDSVRSALLEGVNPLGSVLKVVTAYERGDWAAVEAASPNRSLDDRTLNEAYVDSLAWAEATATG